MEISIKNPCHEKWDSMTPNEQGAFCGKCVKTVIDFSSKSIEEIKDYFSSKQDEKVCGRFEKTQLCSLSFDAFYTEFKGFNFTKRFAVILYFTFGVWLFNASSSIAQTTRHEKGDVEVKTNHAIMGGVRAMPAKQDTPITCVKVYTNPEQNNTLLTGKVQYIEPKVKETPPQKMGEVTIVPKKNNASTSKKKKK